ncbi:class I SAM-dependent methyltransferase [Catenuloplanes atrovinosus]|uniref:SAM-dependent methyltransferase n=1 Tax=Catenuloplanes atrovinosus TaxID=137266 RepID=A0AAE3YQN3_9ACTN|nr:class I SAM-dependent methyltransferase [Catenuloplanes atrovinosus]MDR7276648.1 SAM-dependent methyltransferase [Catenuloplanes atrovinosus]
MRVAEAPRYASTWLDLREPADAAARATELVDLLRGRLADVPDPVILDLGCGTGSMARWLAPLLDGRQHWIMQDRDPDLLDVAAASMIGTGAAVTVETRRGDITKLTAADLDGVSLVTASALLDLLDAGDAARLAAACAESGTPALLTLSVTGRAELDPAEPLDGPLNSAFNAHLRHHVAGRTLLGPDAADALADAFRARGVTVHAAPSPWRLGPDRRELTAEWLRGWVTAASTRLGRDTGVEREIDDYLSRRLARAAAGDLTVTVHHTDLLALPTEVSR